MIVNAILTMFKPCAIRVPSPVILILIFSGIDIPSIEARSAKFVIH